MFPLALYLEQSEHSLLTLSVHMDSDFSPGRGLQIYAPHPCGAGVPTWRPWHYVLDVPQILSDLSGW